MVSASGETRAKGPLGVVMVALLRGYQLVLSPVFYTFGMRCRHGPSCSNYAMDAVRAQGAWRGFWLTLGRLSRCRPGGTHGFDPAPLEKTDAPFWAVWRFRTPYVAPPLPDREEA